MIPNEWQAACSVQSITVMVMMMMWRLVTADVCDLQHNLLQKRSAVCDASVSSNVTDDRG
jgi:invasion protein IalB